MTAAAARCGRRADTLPGTVCAARPAAAKGNYIKHITVATTMGPGIKIDPAAVQSLEVGE